MGFREGFFGAKRGRRTGGEYLREHLAAHLGEPIAIHGDVEFTERTAVLVYRVAQPIPHFLYVTHGLSRTASSQPVAGTQTELSLRVPAPENVAAPAPDWPAARLGALAAHVRDSEEPIEPGHYLDLRAPLCPDARLSAFLFTADPQLPPLHAPTGRVGFVGAIGVTADELDAALSWEPLSFAGLLMDEIPLGISSPHRASLLIDDPFHARFDNKRAAEGSSISAIASKFFDVDPQGRIDLTTHAAVHVLRALKWRLGYGRDFAVLGEDAWVRFIPGEDTTTIEFSEATPANRRRGIRAEPKHLAVMLSADARHEMLAVLDPQPGTYRLSSAPLTLHVIDPAR